MSEIQHCDGCAEDYDPAEETHEGHATCGAKNSEGTACYLEPGHQTNDDGSIRWGGAYHEAVDGKGKGKIEWR